MGKRKLTDSQIINIANTYANYGDAVNMSYLSEMNHVSKSTISNALHYAISNCLINEKVANLIAEKAIRHDNVRKQLLGYAKSNKLTDLYNNLILINIQKEANNSETLDLISKYTELKYQYDTFDEAYSSSDDYPYTKDELKYQLDSIEEAINKKQSTH